MPNFVELWVYLASAPLFGLTATLSVYVLAQALSVRAGHAPWANPVMLSVAALATLMLATGTAYPTYFAGAQFIHFLLGPAVVALGWPLWQRRAALRACWARLVLASLAGGSAAAASAVGLGWALGLPGMYCCRWRPSPSRHRSQWVWPRKSAAYPRWQQCLPH